VKADFMPKHPLTDTRTDHTTVAPSILAADFSRLGDEIRAVDAAGADVIHVDVMDGHFVPNLTIGPPVVRSIRPVTELPFDVHLMITDPREYIDAFSAAGADNITVHAEIEDDVTDVLRQIKALGCSAGISMRPGTAAEAVRPFLSLVDLILVMTVEPGFGGQSFMADQLPKIAAVRRMVTDTGRPIHVEVDGGIDPDTAPLVVEVGANLLVAGTSVFRSPNGMDAAVAALHSIPQSAR